MSIAEPKAEVDREQVAFLSAELQKCQKLRARYLQFRIANANSLQAYVVSTGGYAANQTEEERKQRFAAAARLIKLIDTGNAPADTEPSVIAFVQTTQIAIDGFELAKTLQEKQIKKLAEQLPVAPWVREPEQKGFGILMLGIVIGETGDLFNYANPGKVWKRLGCAPFEKDGMMLMPATWRGRSKLGRDQTKLDAIDWTELGYSPRRRSIAFNISSSLVQGNGDGPYKTRYDMKKASFAERYPDYKPLRCHYHGHLLCAKLLLKNLWLEWVQPEPDEWMNG